jgi:hypothetical protein
MQKNDRQAYEQKNIKECIAGSIRQVKKETREQLDILNDDELNSEEKSQAIKKATEEWEAIEPGYYDCNGGLIIEDKTLDDPDFTFCREDSKSWQFCFRFENESFLPGETIEE